MSNTTQDLWVSWNQIRDFRVQAVTGHFSLSDNVFEGEGSEWVEFTVTIPGPDESGSSTYKPSVSSNPDWPSSSNNNTNGSQQNSPSYNLVIILVFVSVITVLLAVIVYQQRKQRKTKIISPVQP
jgi:hypothetical protein